MSKIDSLIKKYEKELENYIHINTVEEFSFLKTGGTIKYINKYDSNLRCGGLLIKINNVNNDWYCLLKQYTNKTYKVMYNNNLIFYNENNKNKKIRDWADCFITDINNNKYIIE